MNKITVLIVEDEAAAASDLANILLILGYDVVGTTISGKEAVEIAYAMKPQVVLMDIRLEGDVDGIEATEMIQRRLDIPVIYMTAYTDSNTLERVKRTKPFGYIVKPFNVREISVSIEMALHNHQTEQQLRNSEARLALALDSGQMGMWEWDIVAGSLIWNAKEYNLLGIPVGDGHEPLERFFQSISPDDIVALNSSLMAVINDGSDWSKEFRIMHPDGKVRWLTGMGRVFRDPDGHPLKMIGVHYDINERKLAEESLLNTKNLLVEAQKIAHLGSFEYIADTRQMVWSDEEFHIFGLDPSGRSPTYDNMLATLIHPEDAARFHKTFTAAMQSGSSFELEHRIVRPDGSERWLYELVHPYLDWNGKLLRCVGTTLDITERKHAEEERIAMEKQIRETQKLESLGILAGGIAHDFNNILQIITGNADLAMMRLDPDSKEFAYLQRIEKVTKRAADLAGQMLNYSGKGKIEPKSIDLNRQIEEMTEMLKVTISKKTIMKFNLKEELPSIDADPSQIHQVIMNLVINASEAIGDKFGVIEVNTWGTHCNLDYLKEFKHDDVIRDGTYVVMEITDTGCGMDPETVDRIFDPFFTTKFPGRGLGMAVVFGIIRRHKGAIKISSLPGKGSSITVLFPKGDIPFKQNLTADRIETWNGKGTVLLVDDEDFILESVAEMLETLGFNAITANNGKEALKIYSDGKDIDLVILDLTMPEMGGEECFNGLLNYDPNIRVIISSGYSEEDIQRKFSGMGIVGFIQKPYNLGALTDTLKKIYVS